MSFVNARLGISENIPSRQPAHRFKLCTKCNKDRAPEGGIEMGPTKWICAACWTLRATRGTK